MHRENPKVVALFIRELCVRKHYKRPIAEVPNF